MSKLHRIDYRPVPSPGQDLDNPHYYTALTIYPPGTFMGNKHFDVFVGGCGVGDRETLAQAEEYLLQAALRECRRNIEEAEQVAAHYENEMRRLVRAGLHRKP